MTAAADTKLLSPGRQGQSGGAGHRMPLSEGVNADVTGGLSEKVMEVMGSEDPLDKAGFDPIDYLNHQFPTKSSLDRLDPFVVKVAAQISELDDDISEAVQAQSLAGQQAVRDVEEAKVAIKELFEKIKDIKAKAEQSEVMVQEICRDIKQLDYAKRHLQTTITALKRLHMLVTAVDQLKEVAAARQYREAANLLDAVRQLLTHFESYAQVPRISDLSGTVAGIKMELTEQIFTAFNQVGQLASSTADAEGYEREAEVPGQFRSLTEACLVVDALGAKAREKQIESFCGQQIEPYQKLFPRMSDQASLDQLDRRFAWFRRLLRNVDTKFEGVFPPHWRLQHRLCMAFLDRTRMNLLEILGGGSKETEDVTVLLKALQKCLSFEKEACARFEGEQPPPGQGPAPLPELDEEGNLIDPNSAEGIKRKYARQAEQRRRGLTTDTTGPAPPSQFALLSKDGRGAQDHQEEQTLLPISGLLSGVFDPFMAPYIALERKNMDDLMNKGQGSEEDIDRDGKLPVFSTSVNVFVYIKNSTQRCTKLTTGQTFFNLHREYKGCLKAYATSLKAKLPAPVAAVGGQQYRIPEGGEVAVCYVVNTAEYCAEILPQLEDMIKAKIDLSYRDSIDLGPEQELYFDVIAHAINVLVSGLESRLDPAYRAMSAINWGVCEMVGEESEYIRGISDVMTPYIPILRKLLSTVYYRNFCDKFANSFLPSFLNLILRQRRINEMGTQQLLLDVYNLKTLMLKMPSLGLEPEEAPPAPVSYSKYVTKQMSKIEMVLKLVGTPDSMLVETFRIMWPDGGAQDLQAVMALKGMKKADQQTVLETLGLDRVAGSPERSSAAAVAGMPQASRLAANMPNMPKFENTSRDIANKMENSMRNMTSNFGKLTFR